MVTIETDAVRPLLDQLAEGKTRYPCQFHLQIAWPQMLGHGDRRFSQTGKEGTRRSDGMPSAEYQADKGRRVWLGLDGKVTED
jgi:hypothetical protein